MISLVLVGSRQRGRSPLADARAEYIERCCRFRPTSVVQQSDEPAFLAWLGKQGSKADRWLVLLHSEGALLTSTAVAERMQRALDQGKRRHIFAVGPANGWDTTMLTTADLVLSFGAVTLAHELAAVVAAEQIYRALTINAGHPYHLGH